MRAISKLSIGALFVLTTLLTALFFLNTGSVESPAQEPTTAVPTPEQTLPPKPTLTITPTDKTNQNSNHPSGLEGGVVTIGPTQGSGSIATGHQGLSIGNHGFSLGSGQVMKPQADINLNSNIKLNNDVQLNNHIQLMPPKEADLNAIDAILENMAQGNVAFNVPSQLKLDEVAVISLLLGVEEDIKVLVSKVRAEGQKVGARIRVAPRMEARLTGRNLQITAITPEEQAVSQKQITQWKWQITPTTAGKQTLHLTLSALLTIEGQTTPRVLRTFDQDIVVNVSLTQHAKRFVQGNWQWIWAALLVPIAGWLWNRKRLS